MRKLFNVSTKAALFDKKFNKVLVISMDEVNDWGLPGGHIDEGETPDIAMRRELLEECGVTPNTLQRKDFFMHSKGKLILAYIGTVSDTNLKSQQGNIEGKPKWISKSKFMNIQIEPNYRDFVLDNWPEWQFI